VSPEDFVTASPPSLAADGRHVEGSDSYFEASSRRKSAHRYWLHIGLLLATLLTTSIVGSRMLRDFQGNLPPLGVEELWDAFVNGWRQPAALLDGLPFSLTLLAILLAHEFGHFFTCVNYRLDASLPYFLPAPVLTGTFGAFIRIRSPIYFRRALFDVAVGGPLAGFVFLLPALAIGLAFSKVIPGIANEGSFRYGVPPLLWLMEKAIFPGVAASDIYLHPVARAAWIGLLATAWNLLPIGQLDGGHIVYAVAGNRHKLLTWISLGLLVVMGIRFWYGWLVWAVLLFFGRRHPTIIDPESLGTGRKQLAWLTLIIFLLCFTVAPLRENPGF
jgi:membrane-associated protease RseP (regulator of RpoE activity)